MQYDNGAGKPGGAKKQAIQKNELLSSCQHNSRYLRYRDPFGACPCGSTMTLRIDLGAELKAATPIVKTWFRGKESLHPMEAIEVGEDSVLYEAKIAMPEVLTGLFYYSFLINDENKIIYYSGQSGLGDLTITETNQRYQVTVYDKTYQTPSWPKHSVMYHIFVDRFARGGEDGRGGLDRLQYHENLGRYVYRHENWDDQPLYQAHNGAPYYQPDDFYGGDLAGIREKLPYLKELGVGGLYLSPIFEACSNHKYDTSDYRKIDPSFGTNEDFRLLCEEAKALGMHVMLDGVFSHTGSDSVYFNRYQRYPNSGAYNSPSSPYYPWYNFENFPLQYDAWWGFESLPNVNEMFPTYLEYITGEDGVLRYWLRQGASAWRLDVADELPDAFIEKLHEATKAEGQENMLLGEVWEDASNKFSGGEQRKYVMGHELDSVMNYPLRNLIFTFLMGRLHSLECINAMKALQEHYPIPFFHCCLNLLSSHDIPRALSLLGGAPDKDSGFSREQQAKYSLAHEARELANKRLRLATVIQMSLPGCPCVYYGDETGMEGLMDPFNRAGYPWGREDKDLQDFFRKMIHIRNEHDAFQTGRMMLFSPISDILGVCRFHVGGQDMFGDAVEDALYYVFVNRSAEEQTMHFNTQRFHDGPDAAHFPGANGQYTDLLAGGTYSCQGNILTATLPAFAAIVLKRQ